MKYRVKIRNRQKHFAICDWARNNLPRDTYHFRCIVAPMEVFWEWEFKNDADAIMCKLSVG